MSLCDVFSLPRLAALLERVDLMISNDTGPMHLAAAMGTPTIGLFGPQLPQRFGPYPPSQNKAFYKGDGRAYINVHLGRFARCPHDLLNRIAAEEVFAAALELLS
jgi:ADP-heptose:LPS heptosyltransferase